MPSGPDIILTLKVLVSAVTVLFAASLVALATKRVRLHGRINRVFFALTILTVLGFELLLRIGTDVTSQFSAAARDALRIHLYFSVPAALLLPAMLVSGIKRRRSLHVPLGVAFALLWLGTFVSGVFFLPHE
jgi:hypothetical protein